MLLVALSPFVMVTDDDTVSYHYDILNISSVCNNLCLRDFLSCINITKLYCFVTVVVLDMIMLYKSYVV